MTDRHDTHVEWFREPGRSHGIRFSGFISDFDIADLRLDHVDAALLRMKMTTAADFLLTAEVIFRRLNEQAAAKRAETGEAHV